MDLQNKQSSNGVRRVSHIRFLLDLGIPCWALIPNIGLPKLCQVACGTYHI